MYSLTASTDGFKNTSDYATENRSNSGSMFIIKMPDNSLFVIDGGTYYQMSDRACEQLYAFMRSITGQPEDEKIIINTWFISHLHFDHCAGFPRFLHKYNTEFELLNIMYNFDIEGASQKYVRRVARLFPNAKYYKQHTGETFNIAGVQFDVLYTVEDRYKPNSSNKLVLNDAACLGSYTEENNGSTVLRMTFDGKTMLLTGDLEKADALLMKMYPAADLKCDLLQIPHHAFDNHTTLVKTIAPTISFINQAESAIRNREDVYDNNAAWKPYAGAMYYCGEKTVGYAADEGIFYNKVFDTVDFIAWSARTYDVEEANYYDGSSTPTADPEKYYRYSRVTTLTPEENTYVIVDDKLDKPLSYDAVTGAVGNAVPAFHAANDEYYFADSQRRAVNWLISYTTSGSLAEQATSGTTYSGTVPIYKGTGGYWGTPTKGRYLAVANGDTYAATGMFESWTAFSNMMETAKKPILIDLLSGGYFLIYRYGYTSGKYYPVYRDGNNNTGWGSGKLDKSTVTGNLHYFKHRIYTYHDTPDTMLLYWTGHKDYSVYKGTPQNDLVGLISADLRVRYRFEDAKGTGEIFYDGWQGQKAGSYWLEFPQGYKANTPGDYAVSIKYKNASGTVLELGTVTVHVKDPANDPDSKQLFFDFNDDEAARLRYKNQPQYAEINFDGSSRWQFLEYHYTNKINDPTLGIVDTKAGTLQIYSKTADNVKRNLSIRTYAEDTTPLKFDPSYAEVIQLRFKMNNLKAAEGSNPYFRMWYYKNNGSTDEYTYDKDHYFGTDFVADGSYMTITIDLFTAAEIAALNAGTNTPTQTMSSCASITGLRPGFHYLVPVDTSKSSSVTIDYIYIGPKADAPKDEGLNHLFFDYTDTEEDRQRYSHERYNNINFDRQENPFWATSETNTEVQVYNERVIDNKEGVIRVAVAEDHAFGTNNSNLGPWISTTGVPGVYVTRANKPFHGLGYEPGTEDYLQLRFKIDGCIVADPATPTDIVLIYDRSINGVCGRGTYDIVVPYEFETGKYLTVDIPLNAEFLTADCISSLGFRFRGIKAETKGSGTVTLDYIYVGPKGTLPPTSNKEPQLNSSLRLGHTLNLASDITVNYAIPAAMLEGFHMDTVYLEVTTTQYEGNEAVKEVSQRLKPQLRDGYYYFVLEGMTAVQMNDRLRSVLYGTKDGQPYYSEADDYSIADYAYSQLNKEGSTAALRSLCAELLRYGSAAQIFKGYRTDALADAKMTAEQKVLLTPVDTVTFGNHNIIGTELAVPSITWKGKALDLNTKIAILYVIDATNYNADPTDLSLRVCYTNYAGQNVTLTLTDPKPYGGGENCYSFSMDSLLAAELRTVLTAQVYSGSTPLSNTLTYSADTYGNGKVGTLGTLCKALFAYSDSARDFFLK